MARAIRMEDSHVGTAHFYVEENMTTSTISHAHLQQVRRAMREMYATHRGSSNAALAAVKAGHQAYLLLFTEDEKALVLAAAQKEQANSPVGHFIRGMPPFTTFEDAVQALGTQLIEITLGMQA